MIIFYEDKESGIQAGINNEGDLFLGDNQSGYNLPDTPENRAYIKAGFEKCLFRIKKYSFCN